MPIANSHASAPSLASTSSPMAVPVTGSDHRRRNDDLSFTIRTLTPSSELLVARGEHVLVGLSPFNGYYKPALVRALVAWCCNRFAAIDVFVPGYEAAYTLTAGGMTPQEAVHRARRALNKLRNAAVTALRDCGHPNPQARVHTWTTLAERPAYIGLHNWVREQYRRDAVVRDACRQTARAAVSTNSGLEPTDAQLDIAVAYPLAELPLLLDSPSIFGVHSSVFVYHREMEPFTPLLLGHAPTVAPRDTQGFAIVEAGSDVHR